MLRSVKYGLYGAVLAGLVAAPSPGLDVDKTVHLVVDGQSAPSTRPPRSVGDVSASAGYRVAATTWSPRPCRPDPGRQRASSCSAAGCCTWTSTGSAESSGPPRRPSPSRWRQLGYSTSDFVSVSRSRRLPLGRTDIAIRTPQLGDVASTTAATEKVTHHRRDRRPAARPTSASPLGPADRLSAGLGAASRRTRGDPAEAGHQRAALHPDRADPVPDQAAAGLRACYRGTDRWSSRAGKPGRARVTYSLRLRRRQDRRPDQSQDRVVLAPRQGEKVVQGRYATSRLRRHAGLGPGDRPPAAAEIRLRTAAR